MNSVSWFLYLSDVAGSLKTVTTTLLIALPIVGAFVLIFSPLIVMFLEDGPEWVADKIKSILPPLLKTAGVVWIFVCGFSVFIPSKNTMYAIAASEVGEKVIKTEAVQGIASDAQKALHQWLKRQIEPEAKK